MTDMPKHTVHVEKIKPVEIKPSGPADSSWCVVGESPNKHDLKHKRPFAGGPGFILWRTICDIVNAPFDREGARPQSFDKISGGEAPYVSTVIPHLVPPKKKGVDHLVDMVVEYRERFVADLKKHPRKLIIAMGAAALWALTGDFSLKVTKERGSVLDGSKYGFGEGCQIVCVVHPAYIMRGNGSYPQFKGDLNRAVQVLQGKPLAQFVPPKWKTVKTREDLKEFGLYMKSAPIGSVCAADVETTGFNFRHDRLLSCGFSWCGNMVWILPGLKTDWLEEGNEAILVDLAPELSAFFEMLRKERKMRFVWHNGKFDIKFMRHNGYSEEAAYVDEDTMLLSYALDEQPGVHGLEVCAADWLNAPDWKDILESHFPVGQIGPDGKKIKKADCTYDMVPYKVLDQYLAYDVANTWRLFQTLSAQVYADPIANTQYYKTLLPASEFLADVETNGFWVNEQQRQANEDYYQQLIDQVVAEIQEEAGKFDMPGLNPNSPKQLTELLFDRMQLRPLTPVRIPPDSKTGTTTNDDMLEALPQEPVIVALRAYRKYSKAMSTYVRGLQKHVHPDDGRIHPTFKIHGSLTGRLACADPNLMNIPREPRLRQMFGVADGRVLLDIDLNQAELRVLAILSGDEELCAIYTDLESKGLHEEVRAEIFGYRDDWSDEVYAAFKRRWYASEDTEEKNLAVVLKEQKMIAKNVNFGIIYGITSIGLAEQTSFPVKEAQEFLDAWARKFPKAWEFIQNCRKAPLRAQNLVTPFGYRKRHYVVTRERIDAMQNEAANFPMQSIATTINLHGGIKAYKELKELDCHFVDLVHDSNLIDCPDDPTIVKKAAEIYINHVEGIAATWGMDRIPVLADAEVYKYWGGDKLPDSVYLD